MSYRQNKEKIKRLSGYQKKLKIIMGWFYLGHLEIILKYRRSILGPWWATITSSILIVTLSFLWSKIFGMQLNEYVPYFSFGYILWIFFSNSIGESCTLLNENSSIIKQTDTAIFLYAIKNSAKNIILLLHNSFILIIIYLIYLDVSIMNFLFSFLSLICFILSVFFITIIVSIISSRYTDFSQLIINLIQITFFLTPIIWKPSLLKDKVWVTDLNPVFHWIESIRSPILQNNFSYIHINISLISMIVLAILSILVAKITYKKIPLWL